MRAAVRIALDKLVQRKTRDACDKLEKAERVAIAVLAEIGGERLDRLGAAVPKRRWKAFSGLALMERCKNGPVGMEFPEKLNLV